MKKTLFLLSLVLGLSSSIFAESLPQATKWYGVVRSEMYSWVAESLGKDNAIGFKSMTQPITPYGIKVIHIIVDCGTI